MLIKRPLWLLLASLVFSGAVCAEDYPDREQPLINISTRTSITADNSRVTVGFNVPNHPTRGVYPKNLLLRAIGPALIDYGVDHPLPDPVVKVFNTTGVEVSAAWTYDFTQPLSDDPNDTAEARAVVGASVSAAAALVGAFPVPVPDADTVTVADYSLVVGLPPGNYTVAVTSASGASGDVLVEVYSLHN